MSSGVQRSTAGTSPFRPDSPRGQGLQGMQGMQGMQQVLGRLIPLLGLVALLLSACGGTGLTALSRIQGGSGLGGAPATSAAQMLARMGWARERLLLLKAANWYLSRLSLQDQLGQLILNESDGTVYSPDMARMVEQQHITGIIVFGDNYGTFDQTQLLWQTAQAHAPIPMFIATDQEGGGITRISQYYGSFPSPRELGDSGDLQYTYNWGRQVAQDLQSLNINTNFAPVVDVPVNAGEPWGPSRTFSDDPKQVARFAAAFMAGEQQAGEVAAIKHYPGLGSVFEDPHLTLPVVSRTLDQFWQTELYPYKALVSQYPDMVMSTDVLVPAVDPKYPAELSPIWINDILRHQIGYDGVVITDALWMKGIADYWNLGQACVLAIQAGSDICIAAYNSFASQSVFDDLNAAIASGQLTRARIAESVRRVLMVKIKYGMLPIPPAILAGQPQTAP
jgi:beta-N-acetylhexosaminidase